MQRTLIIAAILSMLQISDGAVRAAGDEAASGRLLAQQFCARCHAIDATGKSPFEPAPPFRTLSAKYPLEELEEALAKGIIVGHEAMPEFQLSPEQIDSFIAYLHSLD
ncbi:MAG: cytochrome c [Proteobacteria bacterium]|nr:cytochrome c [Pseudomonadota bacterium]